MATPALAHDAVIPREGSAVGWVYTNGCVHIRPNLQYEQVFLEDRYYVQEGLGRMINLPLLVREHCLGTLNIGSTQPGELEADDLKFLQQVATQIAYAIDHVRAYQQIKQLSEQLRRENEYLAEEVKANRNLKLVVGESPAFRKVLDLVRAVAPTATTVLLLGETGTGKEVLAETIHNLSPRNRKPFIRVNCAALPSGLIESELFGHERGAFTGADQRRAGRFELADGGTLFLDEIGEMPMDTQAKLLRVLQDGLVDRVGGTKPLPVDVRVIAATNSDLPAAIQAGTFRQDLFYRLHIFPIALPALRDRREDIPRLSQYFLEQIGDKLKRNHLAFDAQSLSRLMDYHWPGNVRELQNVIERAVILSQSSRIRVDEILLPAKMSAPPPNATLELAHLQRDHIIKVLDQTSWRIYGAHGAAQLLGLNPETLRSRLRKLGIRRPAQSRP
jgi:formate hydrogenlyase transcriptional activator